jgi:ATP-binding cassette subfamily B (MDR/TAP) protein 1
MGRRETSNADESAAESHTPEPEQERHTPQPEDEAKQQQATSVDIPASDDDHDDSKAVIGDKDKKGQFAKAGRNRADGGADDDGAKGTADVEDFTKEPAKVEFGAVSIRQLFRYADRHDKILMIVGAIAAFINGAGLPSFSEIFGRLINRLAKNPPDVEAQVADLAAIMVYVGIGVGVLSFIQVCTWMIAAERQTSRLRQAYFDALLHQDTEFFDVNKPGGLAARLVGDTRVVKVGINDKVATGIMNLGMFLFGYGFGFYRNWKLTLVMLGTLPFIGAIGGVMAKVLMKSAKETREHFATAGEVSQEVLASIKTVQIFGGEEREVQRFQGHLTAAGAAGIKKEFVTSIGIGASYGIIFASYALAFWFGSYLIRNGEADVGTILSVFFSVIIGSFGIGLVFPTLSALAESQGAANKIYSVINRQPKINLRDEGKKIDHFAGKIEFRDVTFSYPTRREVKLFQKLNLTVEAGQTVAFSGASGCGKSSLIALVQRLYDPEEGQVLIDGVDLKALDLSWWRDSIAVVAQDPALFSGSVRDNVRIGNANATDEEVEQACKRANIHDTIMQFPEQYDTNLGSVGSQLSGGQRQRLTIARAIVKKPKLLILDEATSALDRKSEADVQQALDEIMKEGGIGGAKLTVLVIAHRLTTIRRADAIHYISHDDVKGSHVEESGTFDELLEKKGAFALMAERQNAKPEGEETEISDADEPAPIKSKSPKQPLRRRLSASASRSAVVHAPFGDSTEPVPEGSTAVDVEGATPKRKTSRAKMNLEKEAKLEIKKKKVSTLRVMRLSKGKTWAVLVGLLGSMIAGGVYPAYAVIISKMLNVLGTKTNDEIKAQTPLWAGMFILIGGLVFIGWSLQGFYAVAGEYVTTKLRTQLFRNMLRQDQKFFDTPGRDVGSLGKVLEGDTEAVHLLWGPALGFKVQMFCNIAGGVIVALIFAWKLALVIIATLPVMVGAGVVQQLIIVGLQNHVESKNEDDEDDVVVESLTNIRTIAAFNMADRQMAIFNESAAKERQHGTRIAYIAGVIYGFSQFSTFAIFALAFWYGGRLMGRGEESFSNVMIASMSVLMGALGAGEAGGFAAKSADARKASKIVFALIDHEPEIDIDAGGTTDLGDGAEIEFQAVKFIYPARPKAVVLKKLNETFANGKAVGLTGTTGCGKSTLIQLLCRFYDPAGGNIIVNGTNLNELDIATWRSEMSACFQEPSLLSGTVRDNIRYSRPDASDEDVEKAAKLAAIHDEIQAMPKGYDAEVGYQGRMLSGGQKQRVALARALLRRPRLMLLDEATSALDNASEAKVMRGLDAYRKRHPVTIVSVAHRLTTIQTADKIVLMEAGAVLEEGTHDALVEKGGHYAKRWKQYQESTQ